MSIKVGKTFGAIVALFAGLFAAPAFAHHSFSAEFDREKPVKLTGKVTMMKWANPHAWIYVDVAGPDGQVVNWAFETGAANALIRQGWRKEDLPAGTILVIEGWQARNGKPTANAAAITFTNGRKLFAGSPNTGAPAP